MCLSRFLQCFISVLDQNELKNRFLGQKNLSLDFPATSGQNLGKSDDTSLVLASDVLSDFFFKTFGLFAPIINNNKKLSA